MHHGVQRSATDLSLKVAAENADFMEQNKNLTSVIHSQKKVMRRILRGNTESEERDAKNIGGILS